jgi:hypothetical protein
MAFPRINLRSVDRSDHADSKSVQPGAAPGHSVSEYRKEEEFLIPPRQNTDLRG